MKKSLLYASLAVAFLASCSRGAHIDMRVEGISNEKLAVYKLNVSSSELLDSVKTDASGYLKYNVKVDKGQGEFVYVYRGDVRLASLLLHSGDRVSLQVDTLGTSCYIMNGPEDCFRMRDVESEYAKFLSDMNACTDDRSAVSTYIKYYRDRVGFVLKNSKSLAVVPVLYQTLTPGVPIFSQPTDAIIFRRVTDSLKTVYPDSRFVKALEVETKTRENRLAMSVTLSGAQETGFPELSLPDMNSQKVSLSGIGSKAVLVHFWNCADASQSLFNTDVLLPLYKEYHKRGLEIYSVCITTDKAGWASIVRNQNLPWVNVCDGLGVASPSVALYNVQQLPSSVLIANKEVSAAAISGERALRAELNKLLR